MIKKIFHKIYNLTVDGWCLDDAPIYCVLVSQMVLFLAFCACCLIPCLIVLISQLL